MDSLTQIVLGAAVGEVVLGKKVGNRAMIWGAVAGTIPDLDVITNLWLPDVYALAAHRGFSHSIVFAVLTAPIFGWLVHRFYQSKLDRSPFYKTTMVALLGLFLLLLWSIPLVPLLREGKIPTLFTVSILLAMTTWMGLRARRYWTTSFSDIGQSASWRDWSWLFFWSVFTHPLLDCFTTYGTQLFLPFTNYRVSFSNISVADPIYTFPFLACLIAATYLPKGSLRRARLNWAGIGISSLYMIFTIWNKIQVNQMIQDSLNAQGIAFKRYMSTPSIFNNVLWSGIAETEEGYYYGSYSLFDQRKHMKFVYLEKQYELLDQFGENRKELDILRLFSDGYYTISEIDGQLFLNDMRFGVMGDPENPEEADDFVFRFQLIDQGDILDVKEMRDRPDNPSELLGSLWSRIKGVSD
ncbi:MAG: metal-dependent hydrolase [Bacteroidota bacterium]